MDDTVHRFTDLFSQLGLPSEPREIASFIRRNSPLPGDILLADAPFWTESQRQFIVEKKQQDQAQWTQLIDQLSAALRETPQPEQAGEDACACPTT